MIWWGVRVVGLSVVGDYESNREGNVECNQGVIEEFDLFRVEGLEKIWGGFKVEILIGLGFSQEMRMENIEYNFLNNSLILFIKVILDIVF